MNFHLYRLITAILASIIIFQGKAFSLDFACKDPSTTGRGDYLCSIMETSKDFLDPISKGKQVLDSINDKTVFKGCRKQCKGNCLNSRDFARQDDLDFDMEACIEKCEPKCFQEKMGSLLPPVITAISAYEADCNQSKGGSPCEENEANIYCKPAYVKAARKTLLPKNPLFMTNLRRAYKLIYDVYQRRLVDVRKEIEATSEVIRVGVNKEAACNVLPEPIYMCHLDFSAYNKDALISKYITDIANAKKNDGSLQAAGCTVPNKPKSCEYRASVTITDNKICGFSTFIPGYLVGDFCCVEANNEFGNWHCCPA